MKKWIAMLLACCLLLPCAVFGEAAQEAGEAEQAKLTLHDYRYYFEHRLLPEEFHRNTDELVSFLRENGLFTMWSNFMKNNGQDACYAEGEFAAEELPREDGLFLMRLTLPRPEDTPLCSRIYLCRDPATNKTGFFTIEYDNLLGESWFLCGWTPEGTHMNYGSAAALPDPDDPGYQAALDAEAEQVAGTFRGGR